MGPPNLICLLAWMVMRSVALVSVTVMVPSVRSMAPAEAVASVVEVMAVEMMVSSFSSPVFQAGRVKEKGSGLLSLASLVVSAYSIWKERVSSFPALSGSMRTVLSETRVAAMALETETMAEAASEETEPLVKTYWKVMVARSSGTSLRVRTPASVMLRVASMELPFWSNALSVSVRTWVVKPSGAWGRSSE